MTAQPLSFASLGSGSRGNATLVKKGATCILVDCGFSLAQLKKRLARLGLGIEALTAILVSHEHGDHLRGVGVLARQTGIPVWMTPGTAAAPDIARIPGLRLLNCHQPLEIDEILVQPFPVPHDAREPCQFLLGDGCRRFGILTDCGRETRHITALLDGCDALMIECNHDVGLLAASAYPPAVRQRIAGGFGHLSNDQAAKLLEGLDLSRLQHLVTAHLSEHNNSSALVRQSLATALDCPPEWIAIACQEAGLAWREII